MANMSYCRFQNTLLALQDCDYHIMDKDLSPEENVAKNQLIKLCTDISEVEGDLR